MCVAGASPSAASQPTTEQRVKRITEDLGKRVFQGVEAQGRRTTQTYPEGTIGNSLPLVHIQEQWNTTSSSGLGLTVLQIDEDPRTGKNTHELVTFTHGEPDTSRFEPPAGFEVIIQETHNEVHCPE
jgi:hypothetical protein